MLIHDKKINDKDLQILYKTQIPIFFITESLLQIWC